MFHKAKQREPEATATSVATDTSRAPSPRQEMAAVTQPGASVIGTHTRVQGDIEADEDLTVEGHVKGTITCKQHTVTLGTSGQIIGDVYAHTLHVSGEVEGNLVASHRATIHMGANVRGTLVTPCLMLEDGSTFHGAIDMDPDSDTLKNAFSGIADRGQTLASPDCDDSDADAPDATPAA